MAALTYTRQGGRRIELYIPFEWEGRKVRAIEIAACSLDHLMRWQAGEFPNSMALLAELAGWSMEQLGKLRYPDVDRVLAAFVDIVPAAIQADIGEGKIPITEPPSAPEPLAPEVEVMDTADYPANGNGKDPEPLVPEDQPQWPYPGGTPPSPEPLPDPPASDFDPMSEA